MNILQKSFERKKVVGAKRHVTSPNGYKGRTKAFSCDSCSRYFYTEHKFLEHQEDPGEYHDV